MALNSHATSLSGLYVIERNRLEDERGFLSRLFCMQDLEGAGWTRPVQQINHTLTKTRGTVRGLHFQHPPHAEMKLVSCLKGEVWDVAVDLRQGSATFLQWHAESLSAQNRRALLIPEGFAHGFQAMTDDAELLYLHTASYHREAEDGINPLDEQLAIAWPLPVKIRSERDLGFSMIEDTFNGVKL